MDVISIRGMRVRGRHGADPGEREREQDFEIELDIEADLGLAADTDTLRDTIDYASVHSRVAFVVRSTSFALLERLAQEILSVAAFEDPRVVRARIRIAKPQLLAGATASVTLSRENPGRAEPS